MERTTVRVLDRFRSYDDLRFCISRGRVIYGSSPICGLLLLLSVVLYFCLVIAIDLGAKQSVYHLHT